MSQDGKTDNKSAEKAPNEGIVNRIAEDIHTTAADFDPFHVDGEVHAAHNVSEAAVERLAEDIHTTAADFDPFHVDGEAHAAHEPEAIVERIAEDLHTTKDDFNLFADH